MQEKERKKLLDGVKPNIRNVVVRALRKTMQEDVLSNMEVTIADSVTKHANFVIEIKKHGGIAHLEKVLEELEKSTWKAKEITILPIAPGNITNHDLCVRILI